MYYTWKGRPFLVSIFYSGDSNWLALKEACIEKFGEGIEKEDADNGDSFINWNGSKTNIALSYNSPTDQGCLIFASDKLSPQKNKEMGEWMDKQSGF